MSIKKVLGTDGESRRDLARLIIDAASQRRDSVTAPVEGTHESVMRKVKEAERVIKMSINEPHSI
jgi:dihydroxyacetone kinase-like predicted kinase